MSSSKRGRREQASAEGEPKTLARVWTSEAVQWRGLKQRDPSAVGTDFASIDEALREYRKLYDERDERGLGMIQLELLDLPVQAVRGTDGSMTVTHNSVIVAEYRNHGK